MTKIPNRLHKYVPSMLLFLLFEAVAAAVIFAVIAILSVLAQTPALI